MRKEKACGVFCSRLATREDPLDHHHRGIRLDGLLREGFGP